MHPNDWTMPQRRAAALMLAKLAVQLLGSARDTHARFVLAQARTLLIPGAAEAISPEGDFDLALTMAGVGAAERETHLATIAAILPSAG